MPDKDRPPTLSDVAREAGVSTATVSRCLNSPELVVKSTRDRVNAAVETLGYTPNFAARAMAARQSHTIGAVVPTMENAIFARGLQAFQEELHRQGYTLLVASSGYDPTFEEEQIQALAARGADGLLLIGHDRAPHVYEFLAQRRIPAIIAWAYDADAPVPCTGFDNRAAMRMLTKEVLAEGHTSLGMIGGLTEGNDRALQRIEGARDVIRAAGLPPETLRVVERRYGVDEGKAAFLELMSAPVRPTAVMCGNDVLAVGALRGAQEMNISVPKEVSITGFDDLEIAQIVSPPLTTVHVPHRAMGQQAARALVEMLRSGQIAPSIELPTTLRRRDTLGACPVPDET